MIDERLNALETAIRDTIRWHYYDREYVDIYCDPSYGGIDSELLERFESFIDPKEVEELKRQGIEQAENELNSIVDPDAGEIVVRPYGKTVEITKDMLLNDHAINTMQ